MSKNIPMELLIEWDRIRIKLNPDAVRGDQKEGSNVEGGEVSEVEVN